jgi:hypothetical protein
LIEICFDGLDSSAPKWLRIDSIDDNSIGGGSLYLMGLTLTGRPIYQGVIAHPSRYKSALVSLPNSDARVRIDRPANLEKNIDVWRNSAVAMCTTDPQASHKILNDISASMSVASCPDIGILVSLTVTHHAVQTLALVHLREKGLKSFNGVRGCGEFIYGLPK